MDRKDVEEAYDKFLDGWMRRWEMSDSDEKCGNCKHTNNDLGFVSLRCDLLDPEDDFNKVRSWNGCYFEPSRWEEAEDENERP